MNKIVLLILVLALVTPLLAGSNSKDDHIHEFKARGKGNIKANIRKCLDVKCQADSACFHGRCIKSDSKCATIRCAEGTRCIDGKCVSRKCQAKRTVCPPLGFTAKKERCDSDLLKKCKTSKLVQPTCGFNPKTKEYFDYVSPCDACTDKKCDINFFYPIACSSAPRICSENEDCMNGICTTDLNDPVFDNYETCNSNKDCNITEYCAGHRCVDKRDLYGFLDSVSEEKNILMRLC